MTRNFILLLEQEILKILYSGERFPVLRETARVNIQPGLRVVSCPVLRPKPADGIEAFQRESRRVNMVVAVCAGLKIAMLVQLFANRRRSPYVRFLDDDVCRRRIWRLAE